MVRVRGSVGWCGDGHEGRPQDSVAEAVAAAELVDDLALGPARCRARWRSASCSRGSNWLTGRRVDLADALALEQGSQLAVDRGDALGPRVVGELGGPGVDRPVEVVGDGEHLADQVVTREPEVALALLGGPARKF